MAGSFVFPTRLFAPPALKVGLIGAGQTGGVTLSGEAQFGDLTGGGRWTAEFGESSLWTREKVLAWRRLEAAADNGVTAILVPLGDRRGQPLTNPLSTPDSFGRDTWVTDASAWSADQVTATTTADMALRATEVAFTYGGPLPLLGGEHFSVLHEDWGWRLYRFTRVVSGGLGSDDATVCEFRPPLRQATASGAALNLDSPRCVMRLDGDMILNLDMLKRGKGSAKFVELPSPVAA